MARSPKLTDLQLILLTTAAQRPDGSLLPPPDGVSEQRERIAKAVASLIKRSFATEVDVQEPSCSWRSDADRLIGAVVSDNGRLVIGVEMPPAVGSGSAEAAAGDAASAQSPANGDEAVADPEPTGSAPRAGSKQALVVGLLTRSEGATLTELVEATAWLPHTTRAALTGLRKKGHAIRKTRRDEATCYHIGAAA